MICFLGMKTRMDLFSVFFLAHAGNIAIIYRSILTVARRQPDVTMAPFFDDVTVENNNVK